MRYNIGTFYFRPHRHFNGSETTAVQAYHPGVGYRNIGLVRTEVQVIEAESVEEALTKALDSARPVYGESVMNTHLIEMYW